MTALEYLKRKLLALFESEQIEYIGIRSIESRAVEPVYNFGTETHTYLLSGGVVVHNCDTISMLSVLTPWKPSETGDLTQSEDNGMWELDDEDEPQEGMSSYIV